MGDVQPSSRSISRVAVIGAGPVGVACAKYLLAEKSFDTIDIYEQRDRVGGIWNLSAPQQAKRLPVPQEDPRYGQDLDDVPFEVAALETESPLYDDLETNIPKHMMAFSDQPFPADEPLFPRHEAVLRYLEEYAAEVRPLIRFRTSVKRVHEVADRSSRTRWSLVADDLEAKQTTTATYDAVVVANGHYTIPYVPTIPGIAEWNTHHPGVIIHSKAYRRPADYTGKKVLVIGNSASGLDIAWQIGACCTLPVYLSSRSVSTFGTMPPAPWREDVDEVVEFLPRHQADRAVRFKSGRIETHLDAVVFATGYFYSYPFLSTLSPSLVGDGFRTRGTYQHLFAIDHPTLAFPVINVKVVPFPLAQNQAAVIARVWSGRLPLPSPTEMRRWEHDVMRQKGAGKYFHLKVFPEDAAQINELDDWAGTAAKRDGLENDGVGRLGLRWHEREVWTRSKFPAIKAAYLARGDDRVKIRRIEELDFDYDAWRQAAKEEDLRMFQAAQC